MVDWSNRYLDRRPSQYGSKERSGSGHLVGMARLALPRIRRRIVEWMQCSNGSKVWRKAKD